MVYLLISKNLWIRMTHSNISCIPKMACMWMEASVNDTLFKFPFFNKNANGNVKMHIN